MRETATTIPPPALLAELWVFPQLPSDVSWQARRPAVSWAASKGY